jgi:hypothetical protein
VTTHQWSAPPQRWSASSSADDQTSSGNDQDDHDNDHLQVAASAEVSDAEALLACRSYLRKRKMLGGWTQQQRRQFLQQQQQQSGLSSSMSFLLGIEPNDADDDLLSETIQDDYEKKRKKDIDQDDMFDDEDISATNRPYAETTETMLLLGPLSASTNAATIPTLEWAESFIAAPLAPSLTHQKRSRAALQRWQQPEWKEYWYQQRWGHIKQQQQSSSSSSLIQKQQIRRIQRFQQQLLNNSNLEELLSLEDWDTMSPADMEQAIRTYVTSNQNRVLSRKQTLQSRKLALQQNWIQVTTNAAVAAAAAAAIQWNQSTTSYNQTFGASTNTTQSAASWNPPTEKFLQEARRQRSERSRLIYQKRLENEQQLLALQQIDVPLTAPLLSPSLNARRRYPSNSPQDAMKRIQQVLDKLPAAKHASTTAGARTSPSNDMTAPFAMLYSSLSDDVKLILAPNKLAGRKDLLRLILSRCFQLRGKCVPPMDDLSMMAMNGERHKLKVQQHDEREVVAFQSYDDDHEEHPVNNENCLFVTQCTVEHLGMFILHLLSRQQRIQQTHQRADITINPVAIEIQVENKQRDGARTEA